MNTETIPLSRMRREFNAIFRRLTRGEVDVYVVKRNGEERFALVGLPTVERWYKQLELLGETARRPEFEEVPPDEGSASPDPEDSP